MNGNETVMNHSLTMRHLKVRYGCYIKILNITSESSKLLSEKDNFNLYFVIFCAIFAIVNIISNILMINGLIKTNRKMNFVQNLFVYLSCVDLIA